MEHTSEELYQALQHNLANAGDCECDWAEKDSNGGQRDVKALQLYTEALMCSPFAPKHLVYQLLKGISTVISRHKKFVDADLDETLESELSVYNVNVAKNKDLIFVVDYSGSMAGGKMRRSRNGL